MQLYFEIFAFCSFLTQQLKLPARAEVLKLSPRCFLPGGCSRTLFYAHGADPDFISEAAQSVLPREDKNVNGMALA